VLIVVSIAGIGAFVRVWPARPAAPRVTPILASHPIHMFEAPPAVGNEVESGFDPTPLLRIVEARQTEHVESEAIRALQMTLERPVTEDARLRQDFGGQEAQVDLTAPTHPVLESRVLNVPRVEPIALTQRVAQQLPADTSMNPFIEIPTVAVTRVLEVAGRGLRTSARATTALVRLAF
jgi:hypothetical protein